MGFPIINIATLGGAINRKKYKRCPKCKGKGYLGKPVWLGNKVCPRCKGSGYKYN